MNLGERRNPFSHSDLQESFQYVEGLNDARTMLADFSSILLGGVRACSLFSSLKNGVGKIGGTGPKL